MTKKKIAIGIGLLISALAAGAAAWIGPSNVIGMLRYDQRVQGKLQVGDRAPDVELLAPDGSGKERLSGRIGERPLVLIFGSFT